MIKSRINFLLFFFALAVFPNCAKKNAKSADFGSVCKMENHEIVEMIGFLHLQSNSKTASANIASNQILFVENKNGTGGFIELEFEGEQPENILGEIRISGKVLKDSNSCILKVEKIEKP
jgi:adenylate cyclase class IV